MKGTFSDSLDPCATSKFIVGLIDIESSSSNGF